MKTKHFKIDTGRVDLEIFYRLLQIVAENWEAKEISQVRLFSAGLVDKYLSITAGRWYHWSVANDPGWSGDAEDLIADSEFKYTYRGLMSRPRPERHWKGRWFEFSTADELQAHA